jgi:hypothetical protein
VPGMSVAANIQSRHCTKRCVFRANIKARKVYLGLCKPHTKVLYKSVIQPLCLLQPCLFASLTQHNRIRSRSSNSCKVLELLPLHYDV